VTCPYFLRRPEVGLEPNNDSVAKRRAQGVLANRRDENGLSEVLCCHVVVKLDKTRPMSSRLQLGHHDLPSVNSDQSLGPFA